MMSPTVMVLRTAVALFQRSETVLAKKSLQGVLISRTMASTLIVNPDLPIIPIKEARRFMQECLKAAGAEDSNANEMADLLIEADYRGHYSHGMNRLEMYVKDIQHGTTSGTAKPKILKESPATAWVDGNNALGAVVGNFCMRLAIKKAKTVGVGWVVAKASNHYGIAAMYTIEAMKQGVIGISFTNTSPLMAPTRSKEAALGTNPISISAAGEKDDYFLLDMATTAVAVGKIEIQRRKGQPIPEGWAQDKDGKPTTDPTTAYEAGCLMPLGGDETHSGFKGYGLATAVDILSAGLADGSYASNVRRWGDSSRPANLGQAFIAVDPKFFAPGFEGRVEDTLKILRNLTSTNCEKSVMVAGDPERQHMAFVDKIGGVQYVKNQLDSCKKLSNELKIRDLQPLKK